MAIFSSCKLTGINSTSQLVIIGKNINYLLAIINKDKKVKMFPGKHGVKNILVVLLAIIINLLHFNPLYAHEIVNSSGNGAVNTAIHHEATSASYLHETSHNFATINPQVVNPQIEISAILHSMVNSSLDLSSVLHSVNLGNLSPLVAINVNGHSVEFSSSQVVTPAEAIALSQVLNGNHQTLFLGALGQAVSGSLNAATLGNHVNNLELASGVTLVDNSRSLILSGNLANYGDIQFIGSGNLTANNILNANNAIIQSSGSLGLTVNNALINFGSIVGGSGVNLNAPLIYNIGQIDASLGNINIVSANNLDITSAAGINGTVGSLEAFSGNINLSSGSNSTEGLNLAYGNYFSQALNINAGSGYLEAGIGNVTGSININAGSAHLASSTANMILGNEKITGDPTFFNTGNIQIQGVINANENLAILAGGNITANNATASIIDPGFNVTLIAGATVTTTSTPLAQQTGGAIGSAAGININGGVSTGTPIVNGSGSEQVTVNFSAPTGGNIDLTTSGAATVINTSFTTGNGGSVTLVALANGTTGGQVLIASGSAINTGSSNPGSSGGNVTVIADASPGTSTNTISLGGHYN